MDEKEASKSILPLSAERKNVNSWGLFAFIFMSACGGAYGAESTIRGAGFLLAFVIPLLLTFTWSFPIALVTAELATAIPVDGGFVIWIHRAFGTFWATQAQYWSVVSTMGLLACYAKILADYMDFLYGFDHIGNIIVQISAVAIAFLLQSPGSKALEKSIFLLTMLIILPFALIFFMGVGHVDYTVLKTPPVTWNIHFALTVCLWNQTGFDNVAIIAGHVKDHRIWFRTLVVGAISVSLVYSLPILVATLSGDATDNWRDGHWPSVASDVAETAFGGDGVWMKYWVAITGVIAQLGKMLTSLYMAAQAVWVSARIGHIPQIFGAHTQFENPWIASLFLSLISCAVIPFFTFRYLVYLYMEFYSISLLLRFLAFLYLRFKEPDLIRPFKIPVGWRGALMLIVLPVLLCFSTIVFNGVEGLAITGGFVLLGILCYPLVLLFKQKTGWFSVDFGLLQDLGPHGLTLEKECEGWNNGKGPSHKYLDPLKDTISAQHAETVSQKYQRDAKEYIPTGDASYVNPPSRRNSVAGNDIDQRPADFSLDLDRDGASGNKTDDEDTEEEEQVRKRLI